MINSDSSDGDNDVLQAIPFSTNLTNDGLLQVFQESVNSVSQEENILFSNLVQEANDFRIRTPDDVDRDNLPDKYQNLKLIIDKNGKMRVPNLFQVNDRPEIPSLLERYLAMQQGLLEKEQKTLAEIEEEIEELRNSNKSVDFEFDKDYFDVEKEPEKPFSKEQDKDFKQSEIYVKPKKYQETEKHENRNIGDGLEIYEIFTSTTIPEKSTTSTTTSTSTTTTSTTTTSTTSTTTTLTPIPTTINTVATTTTKRAFMQSSPTPRRIIIKSTRRPDGSLTREFINSLSSSEEKDNVKDFLNYSQFNIETFLKRANKGKKKIIHKLSPKKRPEESKIINRKNDILQNKSSTRFPHFQPNKNQNKRRKHFKTKNFLLKKVFPEENNTKNIIIGDKNVKNEDAKSVDFSEVSPMYNDLAVETEDFKRELNPDDERVHVNSPPIPNVDPLPESVKASAAHRTPQPQVNISPDHSPTQNINLVKDPQMLSKPVFTATSKTRATPFNGSFVPVPNWGNQFQPYLVTTTRPDTSTTKSYEFASQSSFVSINLGRKEENSEVYPFAEGLSINLKPDHPVTKEKVEDNVESASVIKTIEESVHEIAKQPEAPIKLPPKIPPYLSSIYHVVTPSPKSKQRPVFNPNGNHVPLIQSLPPQNFPHSIQHAFPSFPTSTFPPYHEDMAPTEDEDDPLSDVLNDSTQDNYIPISVFRNNPPVEVSTLPPLFSSSTPYPNLPHIVPHHHPSVSPPPSPYPLFHHSTTPIPLPHHTTSSPLSFQFTTTRPSIRYPNNFHHTTRTPVPFPLNPSINKVTPLPIFYNSVTPTRQPRPEPTYRYSTFAPSSSLPSFAPAFHSSPHKVSPVAPVNASSDPLLDSAFSSSTRDETIILEEEFKPKRSSIADVLKSFKQKTYLSLKSPRNEDLQSFSYQQYTTPAQNIKIVSDHLATTTISPPVLKHSPTPKLINPFELVEKPQSQPLWKDSDIILSFKSQPEEPLPPEDFQSYTNYDPKLFDNPYYSQENLYPSLISRPIRFHQV